MKELKLCACGCGLQTKSTFVSGHNRRNQIRGGFPDGVLVDEKDRWLGKAFTWILDNKGYVVTSRRYLGTRILLKLHRVITQALQGEHVDHFNHNKRDNRRNNLIRTTPALNNFNRKGAAAQSTTGVRNVYPSPDGHYHVQVQLSGTKYRSQAANSLEEATAIASDFRERALRESLENH